MSATRRVLITGATGFLGRNTVPAFLKSGWDVIATSRSETAMSSSGAWRAIDLLDSDAVDQLLRDVRPSHLVHLAWRPVRGDIFESSDNHVWRESTMSLARKFWEHGGVRFLGCGTCVEYPQLERPLIEGDAVSLPETVYGQVKARLARDLEGCASKAGRSFAWARVFHAYGPWESEQRLMPTLISALRRGERAKTTHGEQRRDYVYAGDIAKAFVRLASRPVEGAVNVASGAPVRIREVAQEIARQLDRSDLLDIGALAARPGEPQTIIADISRLKIEVGMSPPTALAQGIARTIAWHKETYPLVGESPRCGA